MMDHPGSSKSTVMAEANEAASEPPPNVARENMPESTTQANGFVQDKNLSLPTDSPAPWKLKCEAYAIPFRLKPGKLPPGLYHPLDTPPEGPGNDDFKGVRKVLFGEVDKYRTQD